LPIFRLDRHLSIVQWPVFAGFGQARGYNLVKLVPCSLFLVPCSLFLVHGSLVKVAESEIDNRKSKI
jgi:hypothetical protein